jgi:choline dehydrogenase-like flavoprotein
MLSGIGPKDQLKKLNISVVKDLPVGHNLQDQFGTQMTYTIDKSKTLNVHKDIDFMQFMKYILYSEGILSKAPIDSLAYINTEHKSTSNSAPNIQLILRPWSLVSDNSLLLKNSYGISDNVWKHFTRHSEKDSFTITANLLHPKSRGTVSLQSNDPYVSPLIDPKYYSNTEDVEAMVKALKFVKNIIQTKYFRAFNVYAFGKPTECDKDLMNINKYNECLARYLTITANAPVGTCRMGDPSQPTSVVDPELRVIGLKGLRVADASVMPTQVSGSPYATTLMIGQRVVEFIIEKDRKFLHKVWQTVNTCIMNAILFTFQTIARYYGLQEWEKLIALADTLTGNQLSELANIALF